MNADASIEPGERRAAAVFDGFPSIPRLFRDCVITEKVDGCNGQIYVPDFGAPPVAGSRNRWVTLEDDNRGFARWVADHADELREKLGRGRHFGEWWGAGIRRKYGLKERRFSLLNTGVWSEDNKPPCCHVVPVLYRGPFSTDVVKEALKKLELEGSAAAPGFMRPEGVVVYLTAAGRYFKATLGGDEHKYQSAIVNTARRHAETEGPA